MIYDIKTVKNNTLISTIIVDDSMEHELKKIYNKSYLKSLEKSFGNVILEKRVEKEEVVYRRIKVTKNEKQLR